jgi:hypothetical protein
MAQMIAKAGVIVAHVGLFVRVFFIRVGFVYVQYGRLLDVAGHI